MEESTNYKLQKFINAVNEEIDSQVDNILSEAEAEKNSIIEAARTTSENMADSHLISAKKKTNNKYVRDLSFAELNMKKEILHHRESLSEKVFSAVTDKIESFRQTDKYPEQLKKILFDMNLSGNIEVRLSPADMKYRDDLCSALMDKEKVRFVPDDAIKLGGLSVYAADKGTITDKTFDLAVEEQKNNFINSNVFAE